MRNKPESILWSLEMIKRASSRPDGCVIKDTGGFIKDGQVDDLIDLLNEQIKKDTRDYQPIEVVAKSKVKTNKNKPRWFDSYWGEKGLKKNE